MHLHMFPFKIGNMLKTTNKQRKSIKQIIVLLCQLISEPKTIVYMYLNLS